MTSNQGSKTSSHFNALRLRGLLGFKAIDRLPEPGLDRLLHGCLILRLLHRLDGSSSLIKWDVMARHGRQPFSIRNEFHQRTFAAWVGPVRIAIIQAGKRIRKNCRSWCCFSPVRNPVSAPFDKLQFGFENSKNILVLFCHHLTPFQALSTKIFPRSLPRRVPLTAKTRTLRRFGL